MKHVLQYSVGGIIFALAACFVLAPRLYPKYETNILDFALSVIPATVTVMIVDYRLCRNPQRPQLLTLVAAVGLGTAILTHFIGFATTTIAAVMSVGFAVAIMFLELINPTPQPSQ